MQLNLSTGWRKQKTIEVIQLLPPEDGRNENGSRITTSTTTLKPNKNKNDGTLVGLSRIVCC